MAPRWYKKPKKPSPVVERFEEEDEEEDNSSGDAVDQFFQKLKEEQQRENPDLYAPLKKKGDKR